MKTDRVRDIFKQYPKSKELFEDINGQVWVNRTTAEMQSKGAAITVHKRSDYIKKTEK